MGASLPSGSRSPQTWRPTLRVRIETGFPAAHRIRIDAHARGTLEPVHVHHWRACAHLDWQGDHGPPEPVVATAHDLLAGWVARYRGRSLNDVPPFDRINPTAEEVAVELARELGQHLPEELEVSQITIGEAAGFSASYRPLVGAQQTVV